MMSFHLGDRGGPSTQPPESHCVTRFRPRGVGEIADRAGSNNWRLAAIGAGLPLHAPA